MPLGTPLYKEALPWPGGGNAGLRYNKFFDCWNANFTKIREPGQQLRGGKQDWVMRAATIVGDQDLLHEHAERQRLLAKAQNGSYFEGATEWRLVSGLGIAHPVENGF